MEDANPMARRLKTLQEKDPLLVLNQGVEALVNAPEELKTAYAEPLIRAQMMAEQQGGKTKWR